MDQFLRGMVAAGCLILGLFFLRFYRRDRDRLFLCFALAFALLAVDRFVLASVEWYDIKHELARAFPYWARAFAYFLIIVAIIDKNLSKPRRRAET